MTGTSETNDRRARARDEKITVIRASLDNLLDVMNHSLSPEQREQSFAKLDPRYQQMLEAPPEPLEMVPVNMVNRLTEAAAQVLGESSEEFARRVGNEAPLSGSSLRSVTGVWKLMYNRGDVRMVEESESGAVLRLVDFPIEPVHCGRVMGTIEGFLRRSGREDVSVEHPRCFSRGDDACEWHVSWKRQQRLPSVEITLANSTPFDPRS